MMPNESDQHHVVGALRLDIQMPDREMARAIQERLSRLVHGRLLSAAGSVFSDVCPPGLTQRLDRLVVDLGVLRLDRMEEDLMERFVPRLERALSDRLHAAPGQGSAPSSGLASRPAHSLAELFEHLLRHGSLPWWAGAHSGASLEELFLQPVESEPGSVALIVRQLGAWQQPRLRLVRQFSDTALAALVGLLEPDDAAWILQWSRQVSEVHRKEPIAAVGTREFHEAKWDVTLQTLLEEHGTRFNTKSFLRRNIEGLAQRFAVEYRELIHQMASAAVDLGVSGSPPLLKTLLRELDEGAALAHPASSGKELPVEDGQHDESMEITQPNGWLGSWLRYFGSDAVDARAMASSLIKEWHLQSRECQMFLWEAILMRGQAVDIAARMIALFPSEDWEAVQTTLPHAFDPLALQGLLAGLAEIHHASSSVAWRTSWWQKVFELALQRRTPGSAMAVDARALGIMLRAALPPGLSLAEACRQISLRPEVHRHPTLRRAIEGLDAKHDAAANPPESDVLWAQLRLEPAALLKRVGEWLEGRPYPSSLEAALPGGPEDLLMWLELQHRSAAGAFLRQRSRSLDWRRLATRLTPGVRRRLLGLLAPRPAAALQAVVEVILMNHAVLFGRTISARRLEQACWEAMARSLSSSRPQPGVHGMRVLVRKCLDDIAGRFNVTSEILARRLRAVTAALPPAQRAALVQWYPGGGQDSSAGEEGSSDQASAKALQRFMVSGSDGVKRLRWWRALLAPAPPRNMRAALLKVLVGMTERNGRFLYRDLLEAAAPDWRIVDRILATGGERFFLWVAVDAPRGWCAELLGWLALAEKAHSSLGLFPFAAGEWRARALRELFLLDRQISVRAIRPGAVILELLRRCGVHTHVLSRWRSILPGFRRPLPGLSALRHAPAFQGLAAILRAWIQDGKVPASPKIQAFLNLAAEGGGLAKSVTKAAAVRSKPAARPQPPPGPRLLQAGDSFYIENAGLVILAPFFVRYHEANGLIEDGRFRDTAAAGRAVHLLQVLLADVQAAPEQALVLNKVLCGLMPQTPVLREIDPTEQELANATMVIHSAIQNWPTAGNLSVDGFRGSFLWRKGRLMRGEERWTLTIERRGYDVLFSSLPWSFSVIKPAWMPDPLYVEWV